MMPSARFAWRGGEVVAEIKKRSLKQTIALATIILNDAKANCPVDLSPNRDPKRKHLRDTGVIVILPGNKVEIRFTAFYASYVHDGTWKMKARPFLQQAMTKNAPELKTRTRQVLTGLHLKG